MRIANNVDRPSLISINLMGRIEQVTGFEITKEFKLSGPKHATVASGSKKVK